MALYKGKKLIAGNGGVSKTYVDNAISNLNNSKIEKSDVSNPNLIINPDFKINQRGKTEYKDNSIEEKYIVDRWVRSPYTYVTVEDNGLSLSYLDGAPTSGKNIYSILENMSAYKGKTLTYSVKADGVIWTCTGVIPDPSTIEVDVSLIKTDDIATGQSIRLDYHKSHPDAMFCVIEGFSTIEWAKLEVGSTPTPFVAPNLALELVKCQKYYCTGTFAFAMNTTFYDGNFIVIPNVKFPVTMRIIPTVTIYSINRKIGTLSSWSDHVDSTAYTACTARTISKDGFNALGSDLGNFSVTDSTLYIAEYVASAEL